jgi:hypothetical protein
MYGLVLESGKRWIEVAADFQVEDAIAVFGDEKPHRHFLTRARGGSKTTDMAGFAVSWLAAEAPMRARGYVVASNGEQAGILIDAAASLIARTPELEGVLIVENERIIAPNGAWIRVLNLSDSGAWGLRDAHILICDEFCQWPETRGAKRVYTAIRSTVQKVDGCRLIILSSAGEPSHWSRKIFDAAVRDRLWRVNEVPGPPPWQDPEEIESLRNDLTPSEFDRLVMNIWSEDEDRAISEDDWNKAAQKCKISGDARQRSLHLRDPKAGVKYVCTVDIGTKSDATVVVLAHKEPIGKLPGAPNRVVVDHLERWTGTKKRPVQLEEVENFIAAWAPRYNRARVYGDPTQFIGTLQNLNKRGVRTEEWVFSTTSVGQVAVSLVQTFRNALIFVPDAPVLKDELLAVKLRESSPGVSRLDHDSSGHDDQAVTIGVACNLLVGRTGWGGAAAFKEFMQRQIEKRKERPTREAKALTRFQRHLERQAGRSARQQQKRQGACEHRWRDETCVFCGVDRGTLIED